MKRTWRVKVPEDRIAQYAAEAVDSHADLLAMGFRLMASSGVWKTKRDGLTARFVYRLLEKQGGRQTRTFVFRGIRP